MIGIIDWRMAQCDRGGVFRFNTWRMRPWY
jgi:hypothetical protein